MESSEYDHPKAKKWVRPHLVIVVGLLLFETLTGLLILALPFSVKSQMMVLLHTVAGIVFVIPYGWYQVTHWFAYRERPLTHIKLSGYFSMVATLVATVSGLVLTWQAVFQTRISYGWDQVHIVSTVAVLLAAGGHILSPIIRDRRAGKSSSIAPILQAESWFGGNTVFIAGVLGAVVALLAYSYVPPVLDNQFPEGYQFPHGRDSAFAPSLATTATGGALDPQALGQSNSCGSAGCHEDIYDEWQPSAHRYSALDPAFRTIQKRMGEQKGAVATRYCGGCHDPISLFSGTKNLYEKELTNATGLHEGISCVTCHSMKKVDTKGNADYVIGQPERYIGELGGGSVGKAVSDFLIRAYPEQHVESFSRPLYKTPEYCGTCHKQFIDEDLNDVGWVQLQNQYDNWRKSRWNHPGKASETIQCRECHMPLVESNDPASGDALDYNRSPDDGKHRSHRFLATNQLIPELLELPGWREHTRLTEKWLQGEYEVPEIEEKWQSGPVIPVEVSAPERVEPGEKIDISVRFTNNKAGHNFPTGPLDMIQAWLELVVRDEAGRVIFSTGTVDDEHFVEPGAFAFKAEPVDQYGNLIDQHNLWDMVGSRHKRTIYPGFSDQTTVSVPVPDSVRTSDLRVHARLRYRKLNQPMFNAVIPDSLGMETAPITTVAADRDTIILRSTSP